MTMTKPEFELIAKLLKTKASVRKGARLVILGGVFNAEAARRMDTSPQSVHRLVKRMLEVHREIRSVFKVGAKSTPR